MRSLPGMRAGKVRAKHYSMAHVSGTKNNLARRSEDESQSPRRCVSHTYKPTSSTCTRLCLYVHNVPDITRQLTEHKANKPTHTHPVPVISESILPKKSTEISPVLGQEKTKLCPRAWFDFVAVARALRRWSTAAGLTCRLLWARAVLSPRVRAIIVLVHCETALLKRTEFLWLVVVVSSGV